MIEHKSSMRWTMAAATCLAVGLMASAPIALAADPAAVQAPIKGSDVMGDKGRTGPDGWSWAPQTRDQAPADKSNTTANNGRGDPNSRPGPQPSKHLAPGDDPGTPVATAPNGTSPGMTASGAARKP